MNFDVCHVYPFLHRRGGVERYLWELSELQARSQSVLVLAGRGSDTAPGNVQITKVPFVARPHFLTSLTFSLCAQLRLLRRPAKVVHAQGASCFHADVVHAHSVHKAWFLKSLAGLRRFSWPWWRKLCNPLHYLTILVESYQYRYSQATVVAISEVVAQELRDCYRIDPARIRIVYNGVNCEEFHPDNRSRYRDAVRRAQGVKPDDQVLLFVANEFRRKGLAQVLRAVHVAADKRLKLWVIGRSERAPFEELARSLGVVGQVTFIDATPELAPYYAAADVFVFPTLYEPFGLVIAEALAAGLPVIATKTAGACELLTHGEDALLLNNPEDAEELVSCFKHLQDADARAAIRAKGRRTIEQYSWQHLADRLQAVYADVQSRL